MNWYYLKSGQCVGPVPAAEIIRLVREGQLLRNDRVRHDEYGPWLRVAQVPTLRPVARSGRAAAQPQSRNYFAAHWRGQLPLAQSFWLNAFLPLLLLSLAFFAAVQGLLPVGAQSAAPLLAALAVLLLPWQFIGAWRAAERRSGEGQDLAANAACFGLSALVAQLFGLFAWSVPFLAPAPAEVAKAPTAVVAAPRAATAREPAAPRREIPAAPATVQPAPAAAPTAVQLLESAEPFATLRTHAPAEYRAALEQVERTQRSAGEQAALAQAAALVQQLAERYMPRAPDAALSAYVAVLLRELKALQTKNSALCAGFAYPRGEAVRLAEHVDGALLADERAALTELVRAALLRPQARASFEDVQQELVGVYRRVAERHGPAVYRLDKPYETGFDEAQLCQVTIDIYAEFQKLPPAARGKVLRFTLGS